MALKRLTSGQSNLTYGRIAAAHGWFSRIRQVALMYIPYIERQKRLPWQRPVDAGIGNIGILLADHALNPLHNQLPSRYRSHKANYSNFSPKISCHGNDP